MAEEVVTKLTESHPLVSKQCAHCGVPFASGDEVVICPRCKTPHHRHCWTDNLGCTTLGCPQTAQALRPSQQAQEDLGDDRYLIKDRPKQKWRILGAVVAIILLIFLFTRPGPDPAAGKTKITVMTTGGIIETNFYTELAENFNAQHPDLYLESVVTPVQGYEMKLMVLIGAKNAPDIFVCEPQRYLDFAQMGALLDLSGYLAQDQDLVSFLSPVDLAAVTVDGRVYGIPHPFKPEVLAIFVDSPRPDLAWKTLLTIVQEIGENWPQELRQQPALENTGALPNASP